jgi:hypothetical protein
MERQGASRFKGRPANYRAWALRGLGEFEQADELNWRARDEARELGTAEAEAHALLDLADGKLRVGELDAATSLLDAAAPLQELHHANRWRHWLRYRLLRGRLALAKESLEEAQLIACQLRGEADQMGVLRYADLGFLLEVRAAVALGEPVEHAALATVLGRLPAHAGLEGWWLVAEMAAATRTDQFWALAETYADRLAAAAGEHAETFRAYAGARLESMRTVGRQG